MNKRPLDLEINEMLCKFVTEINLANTEDDDEKVDGLINEWGYNFQLMIEKLLIGLQKDNDLLRKELKDHISEKIKLIKQLQDKIEDLKHGTC